MVKNRTNPDWKLVLIILFLLGIGIIMVYSASAIIAYSEMGDWYYYTKRQLLFALVGLLSMYIMMNIDYWLLKRWAKVGLISCFVLLIIVLIPGVGSTRGGATSWLGIGTFGIQPSEFFKLGMIIFLARRFSEQQEKMNSFRKGILPPLLILALAIGLIMLQPDLGSVTVIAGTVLLMIYTAGANTKYLGGMLIVGIVGFIGLILAAPYRISRIVAFLDPWQDPLGAGYQLIQSLYAIGPGGLLGLGLGMSRQKYFYVPEPHTDFIFAILAEELGFIGASTVLLLFISLIWRGLRIAITAPDFFGSFLAVGIVGMVAIQVIINIGVVTGMFPVTGITLPLLSYGGSSLVLTLTAMGILLNISRYSR
ncbi:MAG: stage V sporulation protein E [Vulcanibacillus sp.]